MYELDSEGASMASYRVDAKLYQSKVVYTMELLVSWLQHCHDSYTCVVRPLVPRPASIPSICTPRNLYSAQPVLPEVCTPSSLPHLAHNQHSHIVKNIYEFLY